MGNWPARHNLRDFSDPFGIGSGTCPFGKNSDILLQIGNFHLTYYYLVLILTCTCILLQLISSFLAYLEVVRAGRIHTIYAFDFLAIHFLIWEISFSGWPGRDFFHQNWEKCILFGIGNASFYGTRISRQKNPWTLAVDRVVKPQHKQNIYQVLGLSLAWNT